MTRASSAAAGELAGEVLARTRELAQIPAPTGAEQERAALVARWWQADGWAPRTDEAGNVWGHAVPGTGPCVLVCAHLDTVFGRDVPHVVHETPGRLAGPSVADDSVGVAALSAVASLLRAGTSNGGTAEGGTAEGAAESGRAESGRSGAGTAGDAAAPGGPAGGPAGPVWLVATVGEEGMGDLAGITHALAHPPQSAGGERSRGGQQSGERDGEGLA
jgi:hypothetical protein